MTESVRDHEAHHKIAAHEAVCSERYSNLWEAVKRIESAIMMNNAASDHRLVALSNRMWGLVIGGSAGAFVGLSAVTFWLLTRGKV